MFPLPGVPTRTGDADDEHAVAEDATQSGVAGQNSAARLIATVSWNRCLPSSPKSGGHLDVRQGSRGGSSSAPSPPRGRPASSFTLCSAASSRCPPPPVVLRLHLRRRSTLTGSAAALPPLPDEVERLIYIEHTTGIVAADGSVVPFPAGPLLFCSSSKRICSAVSYPIVQNLHRFPTHKVKVEEAREHRKMILELEKERLAMEQKRLQMEAEKKEKEEDERILAINLDQCQPIQCMYYEGLQEDILQKMMARCCGPSQ
ncbi:unnamed protein product [Urochloa humidicola]